MMSKGPGNDGQRPLRVSLAAVRKRLRETHDPDRLPWKGLRARLGLKRGDGDELELERLLDGWGVDDALTALETLAGPLEAMRLFACRCARATLPFLELRRPGDGRPRAALEAAERYALGQADKEELRLAGAEARDAFRGVIADFGSGPLWPLEELYEPMNAVARCVGLVRYTYRRAVLRPADLGFAFSAALRSVRSFVLHTMAEEDAETNESLYKTDPLKTVYKTYYVIHPLDEAWEGIDLPWLGLARRMSSEAAKTLKSNGIVPPGDLEKDASAAVKTAIFRAVVNSMGKCAIVEARADLTGEFRRLCRLEGEYGAVAARKHIRK
jgi:hypothetical protein